MTRVFTSILLLLTSYAAHSERIQPEYEQAERHVIHPAQVQLALEPAPRINTMPKIYQSCANVCEGALMRNANWDQDEWCKCPEGYLPNFTEWHTGYDIKLPLTRQFNPNWVKSKDCKCMLVETQWDPLGGRYMMSKTTQSCASVCEGATLRDSWKTTAEFCKCPSGFWPSFTEWNKGYTIRSPMTRSFNPLWVKSDDCRCVNAGDPLGGKFMLPKTTQSCAGVCEGATLRDSWKTTEEFCKCPNQFIPKFAEWHEGYEVRSPMPRSFNPHWVKSNDCKCVHEAWAI